jgi:hypothetical protein
MLTAPEVVNVVVLIKFNPEAGLAGAAQRRPVLSPLSATILQEQSQRIVPLA